MNPKDVLTDREFEIYMLTVNDFNNKNIASQLGISYSVVGVHQLNIRRKLKVYSDIALFKLALINKLIDFPV